MIKIWTLHDLSFNILTFDGEVEYWWDALRATIQYLEQYRLQHWFSILKSLSWPLLRPIFFCSGDHQAVFERYYQCRINTQSIDIYTDYYIAFLDAEWIKANVKIALRYDEVPPVSSLNILCPHLHTLPVFSNSRVLEPLAIMPP